MRKKKQPEPDAIRFSHVVAPVIPGFTITNLSEADVLALNQGTVPAWVKDATDSFLAWSKSPAEGLAHDKQARERAKEVA